MNVNLNGIRMCCTQTAPNGVVGRDTMFQFSQNGTLVEARYAGGRIVAGYLVGLLEHGELIFRYCQVSDGARLDGGQSRCKIERAEDGRVRIIESFAWDSSSGAGVNIFEECHQG